MDSLNNFTSESTWPVFAKFYIYLFIKVSPLHIQIKWVSLRNTYLHLFTEAERKYYADFGYLCPHHL